MEHIKKVAIIGAESTGKSALAEALAKHYQCLWVPEFAREYLLALGAPYTAEDVETIAQGQLLLEDRFAEEPHPYLFCDTNLWVIKVWMDSSYQSTPAWIEQEIKLRPYHLHILTDYHIPYEPDPLREHPEQREHFTEIYKQLLEQNGVPYLYVEGSLEERVEQGVTFLIPPLKSGGN
ncbi:hypothetical protein BH09BAC1_BH09BAC1_09230 [soil metagenome]